MRRSRTISASVVSTAFLCAIACPVQSRNSLAGESMPLATRPSTQAQRAIATQPVTNVLELMFVFPGTRFHGLKEAVVKPPSGCELLTLHAADGTNIAALFGRGSPIRTPDNRPVVLYFYGNGTCMAYSLQEFNRFRSLGFSVIMAEYPGYGMSDGMPSESGCYAVADAAYDYLLTRNDIDKSRMIAVGWSLGAAVAIDLASRRHVAGLATFSAFTNVADMVEASKERGGVALAASAIRCRFDNLAKIGAVGCPIFMSHGSQDQLVPPEMLDRLARSAAGKVSVVHVQGAGHNDIFRVGGDALYNQLKRFADALPDVAPTTRPR